jgi:AP-2 complex subunit mu-1
MVYEFLYQKIRIFKAYFKPKFDENSIKNNMTLIYELMDETMDYGFPQITSIDVLRSYINLGQVRTLDGDPQETGQLTSQITGAIDWRREGIRYRKNEVYIDVLESVNLLMSSTGQVLRNDVAGKVMMKTYLSGMPECKFGLNDKLIMDKEAQERGRGARAGRRSVELDDCTFHRCVRLGKFDADRTITFIPPDGEFELMRYRVTDNVNLPFRIIPAVQEEGKTNVSLDLKCIAQFSDKLFATNVVVKVPVPPNTARCSIKVAIGRAKYEPEQRAIVWRVKRFTGRTESIFHADVALTPSIREKAWSRPPIQVEFQVPMFTASGVHVRFLRVYDKAGYHTNRWVRYVTRAGAYQVRI